MGILNNMVCQLCRTVRAASLLTNISPAMTNKTLQVSCESPAALTCLTATQRRWMSSKFKKGNESSHRKDAACIGERDRMYEPQSPYREHWPRHYGWENKLFGGGPLPKLDEEMKNKFNWKKEKDPWDREHALFGQNDYIDILGDGNVRPVDLMHGPSWLRGFRGNEMQRIIRRLQFEGPTLEQLYPTKYHMIQKRLTYLYKHYNLRRSNRIGKGKRTVQK